MEREEKDCSDNKSAVLYWHQKELSALNYNLTRTIQKKNPIDMQSKFSGKRKWQKTQENIVQFAVFLMAFLKFCMNLRLIMNSNLIGGNQ